MQIPFITRSELALVCLITCLVLTCELGAQVPIAKHDSFEIRTTNIRDDIYAVEFYDLSKKQVVKSLSPKEMEARNPWLKQPLRTLSQTSRSRVVSLESLSEREKRSIIKKIAIRPGRESDSLAQKINYAKIYTTTVIRGSNKKYIGLRRWIEYYEDNPDAKRVDDEDVVWSIGGQTDIIILNAQGWQIASWLEPESISELNLSKDARFLLFEAGFSEFDWPEHATKVLKLIDIREKKILLQTALIGADDEVYHLALSQSYGPYFILTYDNLKNRVFRLIINPYIGKLYYKIYEYETADEFLTGSSEVENYEIEKVRNEILKYDSLNFNTQKYRVDIIE